MRVTDDDLRRVLLRAAPASREACPTSEALAATAAGTLEGEGREAVRETLLKYKKVQRLVPRKA